MNKLLALFLFALVAGVSGQIVQCSATQPCTIDGHKHCVAGCDRWKAIKDVESACFTAETSECCTCEKDGNKWKCSGCLIGQTCHPNGGCVMVPPTTAAPTPPPPVYVKIKLNNVDLNVTMKATVEQELKTQFAASLGVMESTFDNFRIVQVGDDVYVDFDIPNSNSGKAPEYLGDTIKMELADSMGAMLTAATNANNVLQNADTTFPVVEGFPPPGVAIQLLFANLSGFADEAAFIAELRVELAEALYIDPATLEPITVESTAQGQVVTVGIKASSGTHATPTDVANQIADDLTDPTSTLAQNANKPGSVFQNLDPSSMPTTGLTPEPTEVTLRLTNTTLGDGTGGTVTEAALKADVILAIVTGTSLTAEQLEDVEIVQDGDGVKVIVRTEADAADTLFVALTNPNSPLITQANADPNSPFAKLDTSAAPEIKRPPTPAVVRIRLTEVAGGATDEELKKKLTEELATALGIAPSTLANMKIIPDAPGVFVEFTIIKPTGMYFKNEDIVKDLKEALTDDDSTILTNAKNDPNSQLAQVDTSFTPTSSTDPATPAPGAGDDDDNSSAVFVKAALSLLLLSAAVVL